MWNVRVTKVCESFFECAEPGDTIPEEFKEIFDDVWDMMDAEARIAAQVEWTKWREAHLDDVAMVDPGPCRSQGLVPMFGGLR